MSAHTKLNVGMRQPTSQLNPFIRTYTGRYINVLDPNSSDIDIADIAHALSCQGRFSGHTRKFYSVANHCCITASVLDSVYHLTPKTCLTGLLHDATEAYLVDLPRPIKKASDLGKYYEEIETGLWKAISARFDVPDIIPEFVKHVDNIMLKTEMRDLMGGVYGSFTYTDDPPLPIHIDPLSPEQAEALYLHSFKEYGGKN